MELSGKNIVFRGGTVITSGRMLKRDVMIQKGRFSRSQQPHPTVVDTTGLILTPGLIDIQINGFGGKPFIAGHAVIALAQDQLPRFGITSFLPTCGSGPIEIYNADSLGTMISKAKSRRGAEPLGWHLEGPFLNPNQHGVHDPAYFQTSVDQSLWKSVFEQGCVRVMTLAPEIAATHLVMELAASAGVTVAIGHSQAEEEELAWAAAHGARFVTHLFNAMPPFHHRSPGIIGATLGKRMFSFTLLSDLHHLCPEALLMARACFSAGLALVSDGAPFFCASETEGTFLGAKVQAQGEKLLTPEGNLAGSLVPLDEQMRRFIRATGCTREYAIRAASELPASLVNCAERKGKIAVGYDADCVLWNEQMQVIASFCRGEPVFCLDEFWARVHVE